MNIRNLYYISTKEAFPQYRLMENIDKDCQEIILNWVHKDVIDIHQERSLYRVGDWFQGLLTPDSIQTKGYLNFDLIEIK